MCQHVSHASSSFLIETSLFVLVVVVVDNDDVYVDVNVSN